MQGYLSRMWVAKETSDAGSQYRCGRVGRGIRPPSIPTSNTQTYTKSIENARFPTFQLDHHDGRTNGPTDQRTDQRTNGPTDQRTDKASYRVACPQLKKQGGLTDKRTDMEVKIERKKIEWAERYHGGV